MPRKYPLPPEVNVEKKRKYYEKLSKDVNRSLKYYFSAARKGSIRRDISFSITENDIIDLWNKQEGKCALSGKPMMLTHGTATSNNPSKISIDRIDSSLGYVKGNVQLITWQVNMAKSTYSTKQLVEMCQDIVENQKKKKEKSIKVVVHRMRLGDVEDPELYAAEPLYQFEQSELGKWVMANAVPESVIWRTYVDHNTYGYQVMVEAEFDGPKATEYFLKWAKTAI